MKLTKIAIFGLTLLWLASCGKDNVDPNALKGFWKQAGMSGRHFYVFGSDRVLWDSSFDRRSVVNLTVIADYRVEGSKLVRGSFVRGMPIEYTIRNVTASGFTLEGSSDNTSLERMTAAEVEAAFGRVYVDKPEELVSDLAARRFRAASVVERLEIGK